MNNEEDTVLHLVMFPWLALGHLIPFLELSKRLAENGHRISFVSTPKNLQRLPLIPPNLSNLINLVTLPLPKLDNLPENAEASTDIPIQKTQLLKNAFDGLQSPLSTFLQNAKPDWIIYDYASHWLPGLAAKLDVPCVFFSVFNAAAQAFIGSPSRLLSCEDHPPPLEDLKKVPKWIPFPSNIMFRTHELLQYYEGAPRESVPGVSDFYRFGMSIRDCQFVALRSCFEFEPEWITFLAELYQKHVILVGSLHPSVQPNIKNDHDNKWSEITDWLGKKEKGSVVYVALGSEAVLSQEQVTELAFGLERSGLPFYWVLRNPSWSLENVLEKLPEGFMERTSDRGIVTSSWVPQVKILSNDSVGAFLTHCGWNSVIEALGFGRALILLPIMNDQGLNARLLEGKGVGLEIQRNERDGSFTSESVTESLRIVMVDKQGEMLRAKAREMRQLFGDKKRMDHYVDGFVQYLKRHRRQGGGVQ